MPSKTATPEVPKTEVRTIEAIITQDGPQRQIVNIDSIVADLGILGPSASRFERTTYLTQCRNLKDSNLMPVLWRQPNGALAVLRFIAR